MKGSRRSHPTGGPQAEACGSDCVLPREGAILTTRSEPTGSPLSPLRDKNLYIRASRISGLELRVTPGPY